MARRVPSSFSSMRRTSESKFTSLAREWRLRSAIFSSSSTMGFSNSSGGSFIGGYSIETGSFLLSIAASSAAASGAMAMPAGGFCAFVSPGAGSP